MGGVAAAVCLSAVPTLRGALRACNFWRRAFPFFLRYKWAEWRINSEEKTEEAREQRWDRLHDYYAPFLLRHILELRGYFIKVGQFASSRNDFIPARVLRELSTLQDQVPGMTAAAVKRVVQGDLGRPLEDVFAEFDYTPLGAASIGQCHRARLRASGQEVCVKVMSPDAEWRFRHDIRASRVFCRLAMPEWVAVLDEVERQFMTEFDYRCEAANLEAVAHNMKRKFGSKVQVPVPLSELTRKHVLVMSFLPGRTLVTTVQVQSPAWDCVSRVSSKDTWASQMPTSENF